MYDKDKTRQLKQNLITKLRKGSPIPLTVVIVLLVLTPCVMYLLWDGRQKLSNNENNFAQLQQTVENLEKQLSLLVSNKKGPRNYGEEKKVSDRGRRNINVTERYYGSGTVYIRWGHNTCPETSSTSLLYTGIVGVSYYSHSGGGCNHLCLPTDPQFGYTMEKHQYSSEYGGSMIAGSEYRFNISYPFNNINNDGKTLDKGDAVCSACYVGSRSVNIMIPAWKTCPEQWTMEYSGYLMTTGYKQHRADYICVDEAPKGKQSGESTSGGSSLSPVEAYCGVLPCPKYTHGFELTCVVCTR